MGKKSRGECLSAKIAHGVLPLAIALGYATQIALALRELHEEGRAHGEVGPDRVRVSPHGAELSPPRPSARRADPRSDVIAFGTLLYQLLTGSKPPRDLSRAVVPNSPGVSPERIRMASQNLALRCLGANGGPPPQIQQALTELRLYSMLAQQSAWHPGPGQELMVTDPDLCQAPVRRPMALAQRLERVEPLEIAAPGSTEIVPSAALERFLVPAEEVRLPQPSGIKCPNCGGLFVYRSRPHTDFEHLLDWIGMRLFRCHRCLYRYVSVLGFVLPKAAPYFW